MTGISDEMRTLVFFPRQFLEVDSDVAPAVEALITSYPNYVTVDSLPMDDQIMKLQVESCF